MKNQQNLWKAGATCLPTDCALERQGSFPPPSDPGCYRRRTLDLTALWSDSIRQLQNIARSLCNRALPQQMKCSCHGTRPCSDQGVLHAEKVARVTLWPRRRSLGASMLTTQGISKGPRCPPGLAQVQMPAAYIPLADGLAFLFN